MYKALLIGVDEYSLKSSYCSLPAVKMDLYRLYKILYNSQCDYSIQMTTSEKSKYAYIKNQLNSFFTNSNSTDVLFFYWAGHGSYGLNEGGQLICYDTVDKMNSIGMKEVADLINYAKSKTMFCVFDCCHSGFIARNEKTKLKIVGKGTAIMMSSDYLQESYEDSKNKKSIFTTLLIEGLEGKAAYRNGEITPASLHDYISNKIECSNLPDKQTPVLKVTGTFTINTISCKKRNTCNHEKSDNEAKSNFNNTSKKTDTTLYANARTHKTKMVSRISLVIIDDNKEFCEVVSQYLTKNYNSKIQVIGVAYDGVDGLELIKTVQPDVAVVDILLPRIDGLMIIESIRKMSIPTCCIVLSLMMSDEKMIKHALTVGADYYLAKPIMLDVLCKRIIEVYNQINTNH